MHATNPVKLSAFCMNCLIKKQLENIKETVPEHIKAQYMKNVFKIIADAEELDTAPVLIEKIGRLHKEYFVEDYSFEELKKTYNHLMLTEEADIKHKIESSHDPLYTAIQYARIGNYIDFGTLTDVSVNKLRQLLVSAKDEAVNAEEYHSFKKDLKNAKALVYLTDNCGEIVLDKLLIETLKQLYPYLSITVIVRGKPVLNDATIKDAIEVGLTKIAEVIDNGNGVAGTHLKGLNQKALEEINSADIIISKGQGNFETLNGCGKNIYYMFLCKCEWFVTRFSLEQFKGVFVNDSRLVMK
jgi:uncharacterized protein with ATP-grasp and redox domains